MATDTNTGGLRKTIDSTEALGVLRECGFKVFSSWQTLGSELRVPLDTRKRLRYEAVASGNHNQALEECLDYWIRNDPCPSWKKLLEAVGRTDEKEAARRMREKFHLAPLQESTIPKRSDEANNTTTLKLFHSTQERLQPLLELSINDFASRCFSKNLIPHSVYEKLFNHTSSTESERATYLLYVVYKRVKSLEDDDRVTEAKEVIRRFGEIVRNTDSILRDVGKEIISLEDSQSLLIRQERIKSSIQSSLNTLAIKLMSQNLITDDEFDATTDPNSNHSKRHLTEIFRTLREAIKQDAEKYQTLLEVLREMGPPISSLAQEI